LVRGAKESKNICERQIASRLEWCDSLEGFQITVHRRGCLGRIHLTHDVHAFYVSVIVWCEKSEPACSWFNYFTYWWLRSVRFACEADGRIFFHYIHFLFVAFYKYIELIFFFSCRLWFLDESQVQWSFFIEMHVWSDDHQKGMQPSSTLCGMLVFNIFFLKLLFPWIDEFIISFQDTYDNLLKRYGDNPSTYPNLGPDLLLETWSSGGLDRNWVYKILNTQPKTCGRPVVLRSLDARNQFRAFKLHNSQQC